MIAMNEKANMTKVMAVIAMMAVVFAGVAVLASDSTDAADEITYISGDIKADTSFDDGTIVVVNGNLNIADNAHLYVTDGAKFTVNEGVTLTVNGENSGIYFSSKADVDINGTLVIGEKGTMDFYTGKLMPQTGQDQAATATDAEPVLEEPGFTINGTLTFQNGTQSPFTEAGVIAVSSAGVVNVTSVGAKVSTVGNFTLGLMPGATFNMRGIASEGIAIIAIPDLSADIDDAAVAGAYIINMFEQIKTENPDLNYSMTSARVSNLTFTSSVETQNVYNDSGRQTVAQTTLGISGTIQNYDVVTTFNDNVTGYKDSNKSDAKDVEFIGTIAISETLNVQKTGSMTIASNTDVTGTLNVAAPADEVGSNFAVADVTDENYAFEGILNVTGTVTIAGESFIANVTYGDVIVNGGTVTITGADNDAVEGYFTEIYGAYYYITADNGTPTTYIVDLDAAIEAAATNEIMEITVSGMSTANKDNDYKGAYAVTSDITLPENVGFIVKNVLYVPAEYTVTIPENAYIDVGESMVIVVDGTVVDNSLNLEVTKEYGGVICEVTIETNDGATRTFTSLRLAIANASEGDVIALAGTVYLDEDLTIPAGITVDVNNESITVDKGAVLTVNGVLDMQTGTVTTEYDDQKQEALGTIVVNNYMIVTGSEIYNADGFNVSGVYFGAEIEGIDGTDFIASVPVFAGYSANATGASVQGTVNVNEDITLTAGETGTYSLSIDGKATFATVNLEGYTIEVGDSGIVSGTFAANGNSVTLANIQAVEGGNVTISNVVDTEEGTNSLSIDGTPAAIDKDGKVLNVSDENYDSDNNVASLAVTAGTVTIDVFNANNLVSFGVSEGTTVDIQDRLDVSDMEIAGTVNVLNDGTLAGDNIIVTGTLNITNIDDDNAVGGNVDVTGDIYIGTTDDFKEQSAATVTGDAITYDGTVYVSAQATLTSEITDNAKSEFYIEDALWMTAYGQTATITDAPVQDAIFNGWVNPEIKDMKPTKDPITIADNERLDADIKYDIYEVQVVADNGVGTVAIDGIVLVKNSNMFIASGLTAGTHTISVDVKNGYSADNVVIQVNGQTISGNTFTLSGTPEAGDNTVTVTITVSGTEASVQEPVTSNDDGMGITDYLLIILVILVIVLAIFVALRMMRS